MKLKYPRELLAEVFKEFKGAARERRTYAALLDVVFFSSLTLVEGEVVRVAVVHHRDGAKGLAEVRDASPESDEDPELAWDVTEIAAHSLDVGTLAKLSRGLEYGAQVVVVGGTSDTLSISGIARRRSRTDGGNVVRIAAPRPGVIVFEREFDEILRFEAGRRATPALNVLGNDGPIRNAVGVIAGEKGEGSRFYSFSEVALRDLIRKMRATGAGAILALRPTAPEENELTKMKLRRMNPSTLADRIRDSTSKRLAALFGPTNDEESTIGGVLSQERRRQDADDAQERLDAAIEDVARMSAIDGAVLAGPGLAIYGAGVVLPSDDHGEVVRALDTKMTQTEPYPAHHRGARHRAAFYFALKNPGGVAFVVSEDGPVSCAILKDGRVVVASVHVSDT